MPSLFKKLTIFFAGVALVGGSAVAVGATTASAALTTATHGTGLMFAGGPGHPGPVWAGTWNNGEPGFCIDFGSSTPNRSGTEVLDGKNIPGMTAEGSKQAKFVANKYSLTTSKDTAANAGLAIWHYRDDKAFNTWYKSARAKGVITNARHNAMYAIIFDAREHADYKMTLDLTHVQVGQIGKGTVKVLGSNGWPAVGRLVTLTTTQTARPNGKILTVNGVKGDKGYTRPNGEVAFTYQRTTTGAVGIRATLTAPSSNNVRISITTKGAQRTLSGGFNDTDKVYDSYDLITNGTISAKCDTKCNGQSTVTFTYKNPAGAQNLTWTEKIGAFTLAKITVKPGTTRTVTRLVADGKVITSSYCYTGSVLGGPCTTPPVVEKDVFEVVCPAWAQADYTIPCNCTPNLPAKITVTSPAGSPRFYRAFVSVNKGAAIPRNLVNGKPTTITTAKLGKNSNVVVSFTVYRDAARTIPMKLNGRLVTIMDDFTVY